jgi:hypothetical protein
MTVLAAKQIPVNRPDAQGTTSKCGRGYPPVDTLTVHILFCGPPNPAQHRVSAMPGLESDMQLVKST